MPSKLLGRLSELPPKTSGFADPWGLVEIQNPRITIPPSVEPNAPPPPEYNPHSGNFAVWGGSNVYDAPFDVFTMPVARDENGGGFVIDFGTAPDAKLNHPPRLENQGQLGTGGFVPVRVVNLAGALAVSATPDPATTTAPAAPAKGK